MITVEKIHYQPWGECIRISNGSVELFATLEFGPRIIRFNAIGHGNLFFEDRENHVSNDLSAYPGYFPYDTWKIYGGHRLWSAPEEMPRSYYTDHDPVAYECFDCGVLLKQSCQPTVCTAASMRIEMAEDGTVTITHRIENHNAWPITFAPWAVTALCKDGLEVVPLPQEQTGLLPNARLALWPYTDMSDTRVYWGKQFITLRQDRTVTQPFKFGIGNTQQYAAYFAHDCLFLKQFPYQETAIYPDFGVSFETYTANEFLEMESLGALREVAPGGYAQHIETWSVFSGVLAPSPQDETAIAATLAPFLKN